MLLQTSIYSSILKINASNYQGMLLNNISTSHLKHYLDLFFFFFITIKYVFPILTHIYFYIR